MRTVSSGESGERFALVRLWQPTLCVIAIMTVAGCSQVDNLKQKMGQGHATAPVTTPNTTSPGTPLPDLTLAAIVDGDLQHGRYSDGQSQLRHYMQLHPNDHSARSLLNQLTVDPEQMLGHRSHPHTVTAGESYSTLAAQYLGDPNLFLILARYNSATNPSMLRAGTTIRIPLSARYPNGAPATAATNGPGSDGPVTSPTPPSPSQQAAQLQDQSVTLYQQGNHAQAQATLDHALILDPQLKPSGPIAATLRNELIANYHQQAIVLYRDQHLDQAIALWDRVLAIDPSYEPAAVYRARAMELKQRLQQY